MKLKHSSIFMKIVILALLLYAGITLTNTKNRITQAREDQAQLQSAVDAARQENAELEYNIAHAGDPETIASIARAKLGLVMPGEKVFYDVNN